MTKLGSLKYDLPTLEYYISYVGLLRRLPTLVEQIWHSNLGFLFFDLPRLESVSLYPMLEFSLISHWFANIVPVNNQFISKFGISQFFPVSTTIMIIIVPLPSGKDWDCTTQEKGIVVHRLIIALSSMTSRGINPGLVHTLNMKS